MRPVHVIGANAENCAYFMALAIVELTSDAGAGLPDSNWRAAFYFIEEIEQKIDVSWWCGIGRHVRAFPVLVPGIEDDDHACPVGGDIEIPFTWVDDPLCVRPHSSLLHNESIAF